jgi:hypothetical protein
MRGDHPLPLKPKLLARDREVLLAIGRFRMLTRPQVRRWFFRDVSEPVVTRFVERTTAAGWLGVERLGGNGMQVFWLTKKGAEALVADGAGAADLFPASGPAAAKDFDHTSAIGEAAVWLASRSAAPDELLPAWALERLFAGKLTAIPDLLALWKGARVALAVEVDLGTEPVTSVLLPKLRELCNVLDRWFPANRATVVVLVPGGRRKAWLAAWLGDLTGRLAVETMTDAFSR